MTVQFNISFYEDAGSNINKKIEYAFSITESDYREFFAALCSGVDTGKYDEAILDRIVRKFGFNEILSG